MCLPIVNLRPNQWFPNLVWAFGLSKKCSCAVTKTYTNFGIHVLDIVFRDTLCHSWAHIDGTVFCYLFPAPATSFSTASKLDEAGTKSCEKNSQTCLENQRALGGYSLNVHTVSDERECQAWCLR